MQQAIKIKSIDMQTKRILQAVVIVMIVVMGAGCAATKEYSSKLFSPRIESANDSPATALRFLELDNLQSEKEGWVSTDIIMGRDTASKTLALDKLAKTLPAIPVAKDTLIAGKEELPNGQTGKTIPVVVEAKPVPATEQPIARNINPGETRDKRTREK
jgi:hypothetical protein